jgi:hypothetical protein
MWTLLSRRVDTEVEGKRRYSYATASVVPDLNRVRLAVQITPLLDTTASGLHLNHHDEVILAHILLDHARSKWI